MALAVRWRHQHADIAALYLVQGIAEHLLAGGIGHLDDPGGVYDNDAVDSSVGDRPGQCLIVAQPLPRTFLQEGEYAGGPDRRESKTPVRQRDPGRAMGWRQEIAGEGENGGEDRKSTRRNSSH